MSTSPITGVSESAAQELEAGLRELGITVRDNLIPQLLHYLELLNKWNRSFNLSGVTDVNDMVALHLLDSLSLSPYLRGERFVDAGTGAGLPGIPLAILHPEKHFVLIDSNGKKTRFLFQVKVALKLSNITIENCRIEHYQSDEQIDMVMCRAFSSLEDTVLKTRQLLTRGCVLLAMKGRFPQQEVDQLPPGYAVTAISKLGIPGSESQRHVIEISRRE
jgi:16S rRNA (guanine527-N7)-methyltransferase